MTEEIQSAPADTAGSDEMVVTYPEPDSNETEVEKPEPPVEPDTPEEKAKKSNSAERRDREKAYKDRLRQEADEANRQAQTAEDRRSRILKAGESAVAPRKADFTDPMEYVAANAVYQAARQTNQNNAGYVAEEAAQARQAAAAREQQIQGMVDGEWQASVDDAKAKYTDFAAVAQNPSLPVSNDMAHLIKTSDSGPDVLYHLGQNPALAAQIAQMPPIEAARAIGRIEALINTPKSRTSSSAPPPITPVKGGAGAMPDPSKMSQSEYRKWREAGGSF